MALFSIDDVTRGQIIYKGPLKAKALATPVEKKKKKSFKAAVLFQEMLTAVMVSENAIVLKAVL